MLASVTLGLVRSSAVRRVGRRRCRPWRDGTHRSPPRPSPSRRLSRDESAGRERSVDDASEADRVARVLAAHGHRPRHVVRPVEHHGMGALDGAGVARCSAAVEDHARPLTANPARGDR